jgi:hypothetical protein
MKKLLFITAIFLISTYSYAKGGHSYSCKGYVQGDNKEPKEYSEISLGYFKDGSFSLSDIIACSGGNFDYKKHKNPIFNKDEFSYTVETKKNAHMYCYASFNLNFKTMHLTSIKRIGHYGMSNQKYIGEFICEELKLVK